MTSMTNWTSRLIFLGLFFTITGLQAQEADHVYDRFPRIASFAELEYPPSARHASVQGVVVVRAQLDDNGNVVSASALSGSADLVPDTLTNVKKWRFEASPVKIAVIVYDFRLRDGLCAGQCNTQFMVWQPNFVTITSSGEPLGPAAPGEVHPGGYNEGLWMTEFADLEYPALARIAHIRGVVVVQVQLDKKGVVVSSAPISGSRYLLSVCLENAKKWHFHPSTPKTAVIVYDFELESEVGECHDPCHKLVSVRGPNFVTITTSLGVLNTQSSHVP
jgi:TonB family protein